ncbi:sulfatase family protein [Aeoliella sp.]|uniref:sulfatase family protein n=1 Tax=Aeoliella sp. TaxID=2795800 RepID=UPI003CCBEE6A
MRITSLFAYAFFAALSSFASLADAATEQPNILFIFADDHAYQAISAYGSNRNQTPNIDRIANQGMRFDRCVVTNSICGPSRAVILTGKYSHKNGFYDNRSVFDGTQMTFPKLLQQAGYQTAMVGKWHLRTDPTGFDFWEVLPGQGRYYSPVFRTPEGRVVKKGYVTDVTTDTALEWLENGRDQQKPFLLMLQHKAPHREWAPGPDHVADYNGETLPEPETLFDDYRNRSDAAKDATMRVGDHMRPMEDLKVWPEGAKYAERQFKLMSPEEQQAWKAAYKEENDAYMQDPPTGEAKTRWNYQRYIKDYLRCIASVDDNVGRVLDYLDEHGLADNTVVVYSSDQGFYLGEHGWYDKRWMYEESFRTPLVVRWPGVVQPGSVEKRMVSNLDFAETFLDIAGVDIPAEMQGASLEPMLRGQPVDQWRDSFYYHYYEGPPASHDVARHYGVATDRYKLIHYYDLDQWEMFDLEDDPNEMMSVFNDPTYADVRAELEQKLAELRQQFEVTSDEPEPLKK